MSSRVVITGIGVVSPIGCSRDEFWRSCLAGRSGVRRLESSWVTETGLATQIAATVNDYDAKCAGLEPREGRLLDRTSLFALGAAREALEDAGFELWRESGGVRGQLRVDGLEPHGLATVVGSGIGGITSMEISHARWRKTRSAQGIKRYSLPMLIPNAPAGQVAIRFGARGECKSISTACASGTMAIGDAWRILRDGEADVVIAGGAEGAAGDDDAYSLLGFERLNALSRRNHEPEQASRPFDRERDGFVLGEGAAILVLEREEHARARGASSYAAISGYASNCDAYSMMQQDETGRTVGKLIDSALRSAQAEIGDVDMISAHGTSTAMNDRTEARVLRAVFGSRCDDLPVTALKSMTGHGIAASGPMETAAAALSLKEDVLVPTINYDYPDPECDIAVVANRPQPRSSNACLKLSYGFGGHNACLVLTRV